MTGTFRTRLTALAAAALFLLAGAGDVLGAHPCAHHDGLGHAEAAADAEARHGHAAHHAHDPGAPAAPGHDADPCSCPGTCSAAAGVALPQTSAVAFDPGVAAHVAAAPRDEAALPARLLPHLLPYALAPPRTA